MKVSIITPMYNSANYIAETIHSVVNQTLNDWEMLIIDNNSSDESASIVHDFCKKDSRIKLIRLYSNYGAAGARNHGIDLAVGDYIAFLDSDDIWMPTFLEEMYCFASINNHDFCFSSYKISEHRIDNHKKDFIVPQRTDYKNMLKVSVISCLTAFIKRTFIADIRMSGEINEDYFFWLQLLKKTSFAYGVKKPLAIYRLRPNSVSRNKFRVATEKWKRLKNEENLSFFKCLYYFGYYFFNGFFKYYL